MRDKQSLILSLFIIFISNSIILVRKRLTQRHALHFIDLQRIRLHVDVLLQHDLCLQQIPEGRLSLQITLVAQT